MKPIAVVTPGHSPFHANYNNPVMFTDPLGLCPECPRDKRYYDARDNFMDYEPTSYVSPNLNGNSWVHSIGRNSRVYERYQMWSDARTLSLDEYAQKYGETYTNMNAYWRYYEEEPMASGVQVKRPELIISGRANSSHQASGGRLFENEGDAYRFMWNSSFDADGNVSNEVAAFLTTDGVLVLPTKGSLPNGEFARNSPRESFNTFLPLSRNKSSGNLYVTFEGNRIQVLGQVHTHPNVQQFGRYEVIPDLNIQNNFLKVPVYIIRSNGFFDLNMNNLGTRQEFFNGTKSLFRR